MKQVSVIILAAGNSGRMGSDKAQLPAGNGFSFAGKLVKGFSEFGVHPIVVVVNKNIDLSELNPAQIIITLNEHLEKGRSWSILQGMKDVPGYCPCFLQNIDNPYLENELMDLLLDSVKPDSYVVPVYQGKGGHPVLLGGQIVNCLKNLNDLPDFRKVLKQFNRIEVAYCDERILLNINTPAEYEQFIKTVEK
jgi:molybdenum cofactor cytidylyltransferase